MKAVDFSCKHDILIRHKDGTLTPMDEPYYETKLIAPNTWQIMSSGDYHYLVAGDEEGIAIDTGYGAGNLREYLESLCGKPVRCCIDTHDHFDHTANNCYFDVVYMAEESVDLAAVPYPSFDGVEFPRDYEVKIVGDNDIIPLKGRDLQVFKCGDHTPGGIAILDRKERILFAGDEIMAHGKPISNTVEKLFNDTKKLMDHRSEFDKICSGPGPEPYDADLVDITYEACQKIMAGERTPEAKSGRHPMPPHKKDEEGGPKIYDCQNPHPEDVHNGKPPMDINSMEVFVWRGREFTFAEDHVFDKK